MAYGRKKFYRKRITVDPKGTLCIKRDEYMWLYNKVKWILGQLNTETMHHTITAAEQAIPQDSPYVIHCTGIAQGDGPNQRTGNSIGNKANLA
jgi:hypothetical protein